MIMTVRFLLVFVMCLVVESEAWSQTTMPAWTPDEATINSIEAKMKLPSLGHWAPGPLNSYTRYYIGMIQDGNRVIYGDLLRGRMATEKPGIYLRAGGGATGGGCDQIVLWYDVNAHRMLHIFCYGLG